MRGVIQVARKGRKRKSGSRKPSGDLRDQPKVSPKVIAMHQPHRQAVPEKHRHDQRAESPFGALVLNHVITGAQYRAGCRYARIFRRYVAAINAPSPNPPSIAGVMEPKYTSHLPDSIARDRKLEYDAAFEYLGRAGQRAQRAVARYAVNDQFCPDAEEIENLRTGLSTLDEHFIEVDREMKR